MVPNASRLGSNHPPGKHIKESDVGNILTFEEAAKRLDIPPLAIGQLIFDRKLIPVGTDEIHSADIEDLRTTEETYLQTLR